MQKQRFFKRTFSVANKNMSELSGSRMEKLFWATHFLQPIVNWCWHELQPKIHFVSKSDLFVTFFLLSKMNHFCDDIFDTLQLQLIISLNAFIFFVSFQVCDFKPFINRGATKRLLLCPCPAMPHFKFTNLTFPPNFCDNAHPSMPQ